MVRDFFLGFIKVHILHHAAQVPIYGLWIKDELAHHGYNLSPGTLYPILHSLEEQGLLKSYSETVDGKVRKYYETTPKGTNVLTGAKGKIKELLDEVM
ncbi:MAG: helix-turn-helix transcriptional regulator [Ignavibacteriae bacterium]|nr:helix-turn-helix transcriptional regulator [Ignavibacteriota bacterium]